MLETQDIRKLVRFSFLNFILLSQKSILEVMNPDIRWKQRFQNFEKAFLFLKSATEKPFLDELQQAGLIQAFEFTFELSWKTLKDYLELKGFPLQYPRDVIKQAFQAELIIDGSLWLEMLEKRNELAHTYDEKHKLMATKTIRERYFPAISQVYDTLRHVR